MDLSAKRAAMRSLSYGVYIVSAYSSGRHTAAIVTWLSQAGLEPPRIMLGLKRDGRIYREIEESRKFVINLVGESQKSFAASFFKKCEVEGQKINDYPFRPGITGAAIFDGVPYYMECEVREWHQGSDHDVLIAEVVEAGARREEKNLDLKQAGWKYGG